MRWQATRGVTGSIRDAEPGFFASFFPAFSCAMPRLFLLLLATNLPRNSAKKEMLSAAAAGPCSVPVPDLAGKRALLMRLMHGATHFPHRCRRSNADGAKAGSGGGSDADDDIVQRLIKLAGPLAGQLSLGTVMGVCSGYALKVVGKAGAFFVGACSAATKTQTKSDR